jgi:hypothetical protein
MIGNKSFITLSLAAALGVLGVASAAASDHAGRGARGGFVVPGSLDGVNPAYHPDIFGNPTAADALKRDRPAVCSTAGRRSSPSPYAAIGLGVGAAG